MTAKALTALRKSVKHWKSLAAGKGDATTNSIYSQHCALCDCYLMIKDVDCCSGCPIAKDGHADCRGTGWTDCRDALHYGYQSEEFKRQAARQLAYLQSLLPAAKRKVKAT